MKEIHHHFSRIAHKYRDLRTTDLEPILFIKKKLQKSLRIKAADVGCGAGRYNLKLFQYLGKRIYLYCIDSNQEMLKQLQDYLKEHKIKNFQVKKSCAGDLPLEEDSLECIFTFNAIHHFPLLRFFKEASRVLKSNGFLFIYTRLRSQNARNIWGGYFPLFCQKETRLYELNELKRCVKKVPRLRIQSLEFFKYRRISTLERLLHQAENHHYSTFYLYNEDEFKRAFEGFKQNILRNFKDLNNITWCDENILLVIRKK